MCCILAEVSAQRVVFQYDSVLLKQGPSTCSESMIQVLHFLQSRQALIVDLSWGFEPNTFLFTSLPYPPIDISSDVIAVLLQHHEMSVPRYSYVRQVRKSNRHTRLAEIRDLTVIIRYMNACLTNDE